MTSTATARGRSARAWPCCGSMPSMGTSAGGGRPCARARPYLATELAHKHMEGAAAPEYSRDT